MAKKTDCIIETVRYAPDGKIDMVRAYERRGAAFSDHFLLARTELVARLRQGKRFAVGVRRPYMGGQFDIGKVVNYFPARDVITTGETGSGDQIEAPIF
jgi:hypothetical protein